jgi:hypothetical protein
MNTAKIWSPQERTKEKTEDNTKNAPKQVPRLGFQPTRDHGLWLALMSELHSIPPESFGERIVAIEDAGGKMQSQRREGTRLAGGGVRA